MATDMSPRAVTARLVRTAQLRRLCLALRRASTFAGVDRRRPAEPAGPAKVG